MTEQIGAADQGSQGGFVRALPVDQLGPNENKAVPLFGGSVLICHAGGQFYAVANQCTHMQSPLEGGRMRGQHIFCPLHGARFDLRDGSASGNLTRTPVRVYPLRVVDGWIEIAPG